MMTIKNATAILGAPLFLVACADPAGQPPEDGPESGQIAAPGAGAGGAAAGTRPSGQSGLVTVEGRITQGVECLTLQTPDGDTWSFNAAGVGFELGDYVRLTGEIADASYCQQGRGTLIPHSIDAVPPPGAQP